LKLRKNEKRETAAEYTVPRCRFVAIIIDYYRDFSERFGATGRTLGADGVQRRRKDHPVELADVQKRPQRDGDRREGHQRRARQQQAADGRLRVRPATRLVHRHPNRPGTLGLPGTSESPSRHRCGGEKKKKMSMK